MDKRELVELTIERLLANFELSPESFDLKHPSATGGYGGPAITWKPRVQIGNYDSVIVDDPNNSHAVTVVLNHLTLELSCHIFLKAPLYMENAKADHIVSSLQSFQKYRGHYRKFQKLCKLIKDRDSRKENMNYLSKLSSVFPDTLDKHILKD